MQEIYNKIRTRILETATEHGFTPDYRYGNEDGTEMPYGFSGIMSIERTKIYEFITSRGTLEQLREFIESREGLESYLENIFPENKHQIEDDESRLELAA